MKRIIHVTISDCRSERRIFNQAFSAREWGYSVHIVALKTPEVPLTETIEGVTVHRLLIRFWRGGPLKFLSFNWKALRYLFRQEADIIHAHDLWVLPAAVVAGQLKRVPVIYDAHEYYRGLLIFQKKRLSGAVWGWLERRLIYRTQGVIAINARQAQLYRESYPGIQPVVIKNVPRHSEMPKPLPRSQREPAIIYQGLFRPGRGLEYLIPALARIPEGELWLVGAGELEGLLREQVQQFQLGHRVRFWGFQPFQKMLSITTRAMVGLALFSGDHLNYQLASPNKFFEYVQAGTPIVATNIPTFRDFINQYAVGQLVDESNLPEALPTILHQLLMDTTLWEQYHRQCLKAAKEWHWEAEAPHLQALYRGVANT